MSVLLSMLACAAVIGPVAAAQASNATLRATLKAAVPKITRSQAKVLNGLATYQQTHSASALVRAIKAQDGVLRTLSIKISSESASNTTGTRAKADIIKGLALIISSNRTLTKALEKSSTGTPVSKARLKAAVSADKRGNADLNAGARLLKV